MSDHLKHWVDLLSIAGVIATLTAILPPMAAAASLVWTLIRIYETKTVQRLLGRSK